MSSLLERYRLAAVAARIYLSGSPFRNMSEDDYGELSTFSRHVIGLVENRISMAAEELDAVLSDDPAAEGIMRILVEMKKAQG